MKYIKATLSLILGILEAIIFIPIMLITIPIRRYNESLYGKKKIISMCVRDLGNRLEIKMPNGEIIYADKENNEDNNPI